MKDCEIFSDLRVPCGSEIVIRADGRNFSKLSKELKLEKPYDNDFTELMIQVCSDFFMEFNPKFVYTFSDEISVWLSEVPFNGRIEKLDSVFASFISGSFTKNLKEHRKFSDLLLNELKPISFDSRIIPLSKSGIIEYFKNRQNEAWRNCLNGYSYWKLREDHKKSHAVEILNKKRSSDLHNILFEKGININDVPSWQRRGIGIYKKRVLIQGFNPLENKKVSSTRSRLNVDYDLPIFNEDFFVKNSIE